MTLSDTGSLSEQAQELVDALSITRDRTNGLWCAPGDGSKLYRLVAARSFKLSGLCQQAVRFVRFLALAGARSYSEILYGQIPNLRASHFRTLAEKASVAGRISNVIEVKHNRIIFLESQMKGHSKNFDLTFDQMTLVAAFIDFIHNSVGYIAANAMFAPMVEQIPSETAIIAGKKIRKELNMWMRGRLETDHHLKQARKMRNFLEFREKNNSVISAECINNDTITAFWLHNCADNGNTGFRRFRSAAHAMVQFYYALQLASYENAIRNTSVLEDDIDIYCSQEFSAADLLDIKLSNDVNVDIKTSGLSVVSSHTYEWSSPLRVLCEPPLNEIKWVIGETREQLSFLLEGTRPKLCLFGDNKPVEKFFITLLRYIVFGDIQEKFISGLKRERQIYIEDLVITYSILQEKYKEISNMLSILADATAWSLAVRGDFNAFALVNETDPSSSLEILRKYNKIKSYDAAHDNDDDHDSQYDNIFSISKFILSDIVNSKLELSTRLRSAFSSINRAGFRNVDFSNTEMQETLVCGCKFLISLTKEVSRMEKWLSQQSLDDQYNKDIDVFFQAFDKIYG